MLQNTFAHINLDKLTLHTKSEYINSLDMKPQKNLPDLSKHKITLQAKRKDALAYLQTHYQMNSFDELTDPSDKVDGFPVGEIKSTLPSDKFKRIFLGEGEQKVWDFINTSKVN